jgi:hypothetical protein
MDNQSNQSNTEHKPKKTHWKFDKYSWNDWSKLGTIIGCICLLIPGLIGFITNIQSTSQITEEDNPYMNCWEPVQTENGG